MGLDMYLEKISKLDDCCIQVGYWRKANHIHNWFVNNVQNGEDDCNSYIVTKEKLINLLDVCKKVLEGSKLVQSKVIIGRVLKDGEWVNNYMDGLVIKDTSVAEKLLPRTSGFFFGSTQYCQGYIEDIKNTINIIEEVLRTTDFENEVITYTSSW